MSRWRSPDVGSLIGRGLASPQARRWLPVAWRLVQALILVGLFHSIMFPTIFTLGIRDLGALTEEGSGLLIMAIAGGALVIVQGWLADTYGLQNSFFLTAACELYVLFYALWGCRTPKAASA